MKKFWNDEKSIFLSQICTWVLTAATLILMGCGPWIVGGFLRLESMPEERFFWPVLCAGYLCGIAALVMFLTLAGILRRIRRQEVFTAKNVSALRRISWTCIGAMVICLFLVFLLQKSVLLFPLVIAEGFVALIVRVVKNVFQQAVRMRQELDLTI